MKTSPNTNGRRIALFQGSFDPFTRGHESIVERALSVFDEVVVTVVHNSAKKGFLSLEDRVRIIESTFRHEPRVRVMASDRLTIDVAEEVGACCLLRGVRSVTDFEYEMSIAEANRHFSNGLETMLMYTLPEMSHISSTIAREWYKYGRDIRAYLPQNIEQQLIEELFNIKQTHLRHSIKTLKQTKQ